MKGRKPKPTRLKLLAGNPGKRPLNGAEPQPAVVAPPCPPWLPEPAVAIWAALVPELAAVGVLSRLDAGALVGFCIALAEVQDATETLATAGRYITVNGLVRKHPATGVRNEALGQLRAFAAELGLTPSARSRLQVPGAGETVDDTDARLLG